MTIDDWRERADTLTEKQYGTRLWRDFQDALECLRIGDRDSVEAWVEETEPQFIKTYEKFEKAGHGEERPGLSERAQAAQVLLMEGVELWLEALNGLREGERESDILANAEHGQRLLIVVQIIKKETPDPQNLIEAWGF